MGNICNRVLFSFLLIGMLLLVFSGVVFAEEHINIMIDDKVVSFNDDEQTPVLIDNRTYVPLRVISESLGYQVEWDAGNKQVLIKTSLDSIFQNPPQNDTDNLRIVIDNNVLEIPEEYGTPFISSKGRTLIPLRITAEALHAEINWSPGVVVVNSRTKQPQPEKVAIANKNEQKIDLTNISLHEMSIMGPSIATKEQITAFLKEQEEPMKEYVETKFGQRFAPFPYYLIDLYLEIGKKYNIRGDIAFAQALKETGYFQFTGLVKPSQNNYCGLWATGVPLLGTEPHNGVDPTKVAFIPGYHGLTFVRPEYGVEAHIQHLYAYANDLPLPEGTVLWDPRFKYVSRAIAPRWIDLNGRWAVPGNGYGESIIEDYWLKAMAK